MAYTKEDLSPKAIEIANKYEIKLDAITDNMNRIMEMDAKGICKFSKEIVIGFDVNGPMVDCADNTLTPFAGSNEACDYLMEQGVAVSLMTGWDLSTMQYYRDNKLKSNVDIVCEYGQVFDHKGDITYLYPYDEKESFEFMVQTLDMMAEHNLKVAVQGNFSAGTGALVVEGDENGDLLDHPMVSGRRPTMDQLFDAAKDGSEVEFDKENNMLVFENSIANMKGIHNALARKHPLISVRVKKLENGKLGIWIDDKDNKEFTYEKLGEFSKIAAQATGRSPQFHRDHGLDLHSKKAIEAKLTKENGLHEYGKKVFGNEDFAAFVVGDMENDIPSVFDKTIFFPLFGCEAEEIVQAQNKENVVSVIDCRDFGLAVAELYRITYK